MKCGLLKSKNVCCVKQMTAVFLNRTGYLCSGFLEKNKIVMNERLVYLYLLTKNIVKRTKKVKEGVKERKCSNKIIHISHPPYCLNLALYGFFAFPSIKKKLS